MHIVQIRHATYQAPPILLVAAPVRLLFSMQRPRVRNSRLTLRLASAIALAAAAFAAWRVWDAIVDHRFWGTVQAALDDRNFATARELLEERLRRSPGESHTLTLAAQAARRDGDLGRFDTWIDRAERAGAVAEVVALERALARVQTGQTADIGHYMEVAESHPLDPASKLLLEAIVEGALVRLDLPAVQRAVALWDSAAKTAEERAASDSWKGEIAVRRGDIAAAADFYRKAVAATPVSSTRRRRLADLLARYAPTEALEHLDFAESQGAAITSSALLTRARCQRALSDFEGAEQSLRKLLVLRPQDYDAHVELGQIALESSRYDVAESALRTAIQQRPAGREALQTLVRCLRLTGKTEEASRMAESLAKLDQRLDETLRQLQQQGKVSP